MKKVLKIILSILLVSFVQTTVFAENNTWTTTDGEAKVNKIGKALLEKNSLPTQINFKVVETDDVNAFANADKEICVYTGLLKFVNDDEELAGVIAHEIGHIVNNHVAKQSIIGAITTTLISNSNLSTEAKSIADSANNLSLLKMSRTEEYEADITGVDLMTKAGYNPLAMVSVLYKISGNYIDFISTHPSGDKRTMYIYDYITYTYPDKAKLGYTTDSYKQFMIYAQSIVNERNQNQRKLASFNKKQEKLQKKRLAKMEKYKKLKNTIFWDSSLNFLNSIATPSAE